MLLLPWPLLTSPGKTAGCAQLCCAVQQKLSARLANAAPGRRHPGAQRLLVLVRGAPGFVAVMLHVALGRYRRVMQSMSVMPMRGMRVMRRGFVIAALVMVRRVSMMLRRMFVVLGRFAMMRCCVLRHGSSCEFSVSQRGAGKLAGGYDCVATAE